MVPDFELPGHLAFYWDKFWSIRGICGAEENPITPDILDQWCRHDYCDFERWERQALFDMDKALRQSSGEVVKFHSERSKIDLKDNDKDALNGRGNSRLRNRQ